MQFRSFRLGIFELSLLFLLILTRFFWIRFSGLDPVEGFQDSNEYIELSSRVLAGNFDFDLYRFIRPPGYPVWVALHRMMFGDYWVQFLVYGNAIFSVLTGCVLYLFSRELFQTRLVALAAVIFFLFDLPVFYYVPVLASETIYTFLVIFTLYAFYRFLKNKRTITGIVFLISFFLSSTFKSFILPALPIFYLFLCWRGWKEKDRRIFHSANLFLIGFVLLSAPFGLYNLHKHGQFIISSNGGAYVFMSANSEPGYLDAVEYSRLSEGMKEKVKNFQDHGEFFFGPQFTEVMGQGQLEKQALYKEIASLWIKNNPKDFFIIRFHNFVRFMVPGKSWMHYSRMEWLKSFIVSLPLHLFAYVGILLVLLSSVLRRQHAWIILYMFITAAALIGSLYTYRYKVYGLDFVYAIYAGYAVWRLWNYLASYSPRLSKWREQIEKN